ncbi:hypothetical protein XENORESO_012916 [Xenotaenia resolanae]|uniref:Uncharacterized protein n=1 Tax=Xenotaenia resolanae TaxID=208358 RepID=A0ABV0X2V9_9TELE
MGVRILARSETANQYLHDNCRPRQPGMLWRRPAKHNETDIRSVARIPKKDMRGNKTSKGYLKPEYKRIIIFEEVLTLQSVFKPLDGCITTKFKKNNTTSLAILKY